MSYDKNGNITNLQRYGDLDASSFNIKIDNLVYTYDPDKQNQLMKVLDTEAHPEGFKDDSVDGITDPTDDYDYDDNGNMISDENKGITNITYNHLNLPIEIIFTGANKKINYIYNAAGGKVKKTVTNGTVITHTYYVSGFQYTQVGTGTVKLDFFPHAEGYVNNTVVANTNVYNYVFNYTDHLGNVRMSYTKNTTTSSLKILEESHYYPYGLKHEKYNMDTWDFIKDEADGHAVGVITAKTARSNYQYKYNNRELQDELGLNMTAMDYRQYDNAIGRFNSIDALSEMSYSISPYAFANNNPVFWSDPTGLLSQAFINALWNNSNSASGITSWVSDGHGNLENTDGTGGINRDGEYYSNTLFEILPEIRIYAGIGDTRNGNILRGHVYQNSNYYQHWRDEQSEKKWDEFQEGVGYIGIIDFTGLVDGLNSLGYLARGQKANAAISALAILPFGDLAKGGKYTKSSLALGREVHLVYKAAEHAPALGKHKEYSKIVGIRPDFVDFTTKTIFELKPNNPRSIKAGEKQLEKYKAVFESEYPGTIWNTVLDKY